MRSAVLEGASQKLNRAREHLEMLAAERVSFEKRMRDREGVPFRIGFQTHVEDNFIWAILEAKEDPPWVTSVMVGDALHNLRCVIDHVAWVLVPEATKQKAKPGRLRQVQFPIVLTMEEFADDAALHLPDVAEVPLGIVRRYQPGQRGEAAESHPLAVLQRLSNEDKHRNIHTVWLTPVGVGVRVRCPPGCQVVEAGPGPGAGKPLEVGAKLAWFRFNDLQVCDGLELEPRLTLQLALGDGLRLETALGEVERLISELLEEIDRVL